MSVSLCITAALLVGYVADLVFGERLAPLCPAILLGKFIAFLEKKLRPGKEGDAQALRRAGAWMAFIVCAVAFFVPAALLALAWRIHPALFFALNAFWFYQIMATRCLRDVCMPIYQALLTGDLEQSRKEVGMIVGRDTNMLTAQGCMKATVETVAENANDGAFAPLFYFALGGAPLSMLYKAINTMDSMVGYKNEKYLDFGRIPAKLDDVANFIPARLCGLLLIAAAFLVPGCSGRDAARIWARDRKKSSSPNSAQTESAVAGALGVELLGDAYYFGKLVKKQSIGDATREIVPEDILKSHRLLFASMTLACILAALVRMAVLGC